VPWLLDPCELGFDMHGKHPPRLFYEVVRFVIEGTRPRKWQVANLQRVIVFARYRNWLDVAFNASCELAQIDPSGWEFMIEVLKDFGSSYPDLPAHVEHILAAAADPGEAVAASTIGLWNAGYQAETQTILEDYFVKKRRGTAAMLQ